LLTILLLASPAVASFRGRDGVLAVQPTTGGGVLLVSLTGPEPVRAALAGGRAPRPVLDSDAVTVVLDGRIRRTGAEALGVG
jgi:hypothetical protein